MVNSFGMPFNSGTIFVALLLIAFLFWIKIHADQGMVQYNTFLLCILFILMGSLPG
jgi:hypothetical protein